MHTIYNSLPSRPQSRRCHVKLLLLLLLPRTIAYLHTDTLHISYNLLLEKKLWPPSYKVYCTYYVRREKPPPYYSTDEPVHVYIYSYKALHEAHPSIELKVTYIPKCLRTEWAEYAVCMYSEFLLHFLHSGRNGIHCTWSNLRMSVR